MTITVKIIRNQRNSPQDKLADAELHFTGGELDGLKLIGFTIWNRRDGTGRNVRFPSRSFTVHRERRSFALLRAIDDLSALDRVRQLVLQAYEAQAAYMAGSDTHASIAGSAEGSHSMTTSHE